MHGLQLPLSCTYVHMLLFDCQDISSHIDIVVLVVVGGFVGYFIWLAMSLEAELLEDDSV